MPIDSSRSPRRSRSSRSARKCGRGSWFAGGMHIRPSQRSASSSRTAAYSGSTSSGSAPPFCGSRPTFTSRRTRWVRFFEKARFESSLASASRSQVCSSAACPTTIFALQTNKAKIVVGHAALVHTCDRLALARELSKRAFSKNLTQRVLLEVNVGREPQKGGALPEEVEPLYAAVRELDALRCEGLMCMPPANQDPRPHFRALRELRDRLGLRELSMGMSADYEVAIQEGATIVRVGTAIFGERPRRAS